MDKHEYITTGGAFESPHDYRDIKDPSLAMALPLPALYETDISNIVVTDQEKLGICTSNLAVIIEWLYFQRTGVYQRLSRRFLYSVTKNLIDQNQIEGSGLRSVLKAAYTYGVCKEETYPSATTNISHADYINPASIPAAAWAEALKYKIGGYVNIPTDKASIEAAIYKYGMLYTRREVGCEWWTAADGTVTWDPKYIDPLRPPKVVISGHAIVDMGYNNTKNLYTLRNSWGEEWNCKGNGHTDIVWYPPTEAWAVTLAPLGNDLPSAADFKHNFTKPMKRGDKDPEVVQLQIALMISNFLAFVPVADRGVYGPQTQAAVYKYQLAKNIPLTAIERLVYKGFYCGPKTLNRLNKDFGMK
jgi:hypothetical protein